ncbi:MAG TPA: dihydrodipicolinate synthase family protein [Gemmatimonadaceae bacterium]|nr:dihydrodipicolinate synthase family protein [Gemmatimonadaceae bacterium]
MAASDALRSHLLAGQVIPAHPLALTPARTLDERRQRALTRYYLAAGAGGLAVGVHTTQFAIRDLAHGLYRPVLELAAETVRAEARSHVALIAGVVGRTKQALAEARIARELCYDAALVSLGAWGDASDAAMVEHCRAVAEVIPIFAFYLQPAVGGRHLGSAFWRALAEIENLVAIKIAPFDRYRTLDVVRAVAEAGRSDVALYTGNDDHIVGDLLARFPFSVRGGRTPVRIVGGLLGQWAVWTRRAVEMLDAVRTIRDGDAVDAEWMRLGAALTDANGAIFDVRNGFAGSIAGIHEILRRQGLLAGTWCLDPCEGLGRGQMEEIDRVLRAYPELTDNDFVAAHLEEWLA